MTAALTQAATKLRATALQKALSRGPRLVIAFVVVLAAGIVVQTPIGWAMHLAGGVPESIPASFQASSGTVWRASFSGVQIDTGQPVVIPRVIARPQVLSLFSGRPRVVLELEWPGAELAIEIAARDEEIHIRLLPARLSLADLRPLLPFPELQLFSGDIALARGDLSLSPQGLVHASDVSFLITGLTLNGSPTELLGNLDVTMNVAEEVAAARLRSTGNDASLQIDGTLHYPLDGSNPSFDGTVNVTPDASRTLREWVAAVRITP